MHLLIVTGLSGSGKSSVLRILEDDGFYCVDNLPSSMLPALMSTCMRTDSTVNNIAVSIDAREHSISDNIDLSYLFNLYVDFEILFLECRDDILLRRYNSSRRMHPMSVDVSVGINRERDFLSSLRDRANYILDTSDLKANQLRDALYQTIHKERTNTFTLTFQSFGYKKGVPLNTDIVYDMRFIRNPFYEESLRELTGLNMSVADYIREDPATAEFLDMAESQLRFLIPKYIQQNKPRLIVSFGCTGGRHRSVFAANEMYERMKNDFTSSIMHRDLSTWKE